MKLAEMKARREDARLKAVAIMDRALKEQRDTTEAEEKEIETLEAEIKGWDKQIIRVQVFKAPDNDGKDGSAAKADESADTPPKDNPEDEERNKKQFRNMGEQLMAVYRAAQPGAQNKLDPRLDTRSASGLNQSNPSDGGFLVQTDFVKDLLKRTYETGILASKVKRIQISNNANGIKINAVDEESRANGSRWGGIQTYWEAEAEQLTASKPKFRKIELSLKKLTGLCYATDELLQDASALESVIREAFAEEFGFKMDDAILCGTGAGQPLGILKSGALVKVEKEPGQAAKDKVTVENLVKMYSRMWSRSRTKAAWYINPEIEPLLYTLRVGDRPVYIPAGGLSEKPYATLLGLPVIALEQCSEVGEPGDIILADLSQYLLIDKGGIDAQSSIHVRFLYDENVFRFIYRADGQPTWHKALLPYKGKATVSPFIALEKR